jgi:hypothetical protein
MLSTSDDVNLLLTQEAMGLINRVNSSASGTVIVTDKRGSNKVLTIKVRLSR